MSSKPLTASKVSVASQAPNSGTLHVADVVREEREKLKATLRRRLRVPEDAEDVAQEACVRLLQYEGASAIRSPSALLHRIAANVANDCARAERVRHRQDHLTLENLDLPDPRPSAERELAAEQDLARLIGAVERLPPKCQQVFLLSRLHGFTYPEIARRCGMSVKMVEKHISRALAICLKEVGEDRSGPSYSV